MIAQVTSDTYRIESFVFVATVGLELATGVPILYKLDSDGKVVSKEILQG